MTINDHLKATDIVIYLDSNLDFEDGVILIKIGALFDQLSWRIKDIPFCIHVLDYIEGCWHH